MRLAIMQPYFLPYIGYWQLMATVDKFVVFDDVHFINRGWINRNRLLLNGKAHTFTVPLCGASQNRLICEIELMEGAWREKLLRTIRQAYSAAPCFEVVFGLMEDIVRYPARRLDAFLLNSLHRIAGYLDLGTEIVATSRIYGNEQLRGQARILDICMREGAGCYINPIGGEALYERSRFSEEGLSLKFLRPRPLVYVQGNDEFVPSLSILDVLMFNTPLQARLLLEERDLV